MKYGIALGSCNAKFFGDVTLEAEALGYESVWLPEHLIFTTKMTRSPRPGETHPPVPPTTPIFDAFAYLSYLAGRTEQELLDQSTDGWSSRRLHNLGDLRRSRGDGRSGACGDR